MSTHVCQLLAHGKGITTSKDLRGTVVFNSENFTVEGDLEEGG